MKMRLNVIILLLLTAILEGYSQDLLKVVDQTVKPLGYTHGWIPEWPLIDSDGNPDPQQALIVVNYDGFPKEEISKVFISPDVDNLNRREDHEDELGQPFTFLYVPLDNRFLSITSPYGPTRVTLPNMENRGIYEMTLLVDKRMNIDIEPLTDEESIKVYLDRSQVKSTPARFNNVTLGRHELMFEFPDGRRETREIFVNVNTLHFNETTTPGLDLRRIIPVRIESTSGNVSVYVNDEKMSDHTPYTAMLPAGDYTIKGVSNTNDRQFDVVPIKLEADSKGTVVKLEPRERHKFVVNASFEGMNVPAMLYIGKEEAYKYSTSQVKGERREYMFDLPVGSKYNFRATYQGNEGKRVIEVKPGMLGIQTIKIKKRKKFVWPWEREYVIPPVGITAAYVRKQYHVKNEGDLTYKGTLTLWDEGIGGDGKWLNGVKAGVQYQPTFKFGLGLYTGLFYEYYFAKTDLYSVNKEEGTTSYFSKYQEHSLSLPVEVFYNLPFASKVALAFHGGVEGSFMLSRSYSGYVEELDGIKFEHSYNTLKDKDGYFPEMPGVFSLYWQIGAQLRLGPFLLGAQLTRPITVHKWEMNGEQFTTTSVKNSFSLTYVF